jgi:hypothetical protein
MTLILLAIIAYPLARSIDRWVQRMENGVFVRRRAAMHEDRR